MSNSSEPIPFDPTPSADDLLEAAWGIIANAGGSDWTRETQEWQDAAARWRTSYFARLDNDTPETVNVPFDKRINDEPYDKGRSQ